MRTAHRKTLMAVIVGLACGGATGANIDPKKAKYDICGRFEVIHINGIKTDEAQARANLTRIAEVYGNSYKEHLIKYFVAHNKTRGFFADFYDSAVQVLSGYAGATWNDWSNAVLNTVYTVLMNQPTAQDVAKRVDDLFALTKPAPYQDQDLNDLMTAINSQTSKTSRKVFVPHSQGNLYMNLVYDKLVAAGHTASSIGVVGIAVPYNTVRTGNTYITSSNDLVIDSVRTALAAVPTQAPILAPNVTIPLDLAVDKAGHYLRETYLANSTVRSMLVSRITSEFNGLKTTAKTENIDPMYTFTGRAAWRDCTVPLDPQGYTWTPYAPQRPSSCGQGYPATMPNVWIVPVVDVTPVGMGQITTRPGSPGEVPGLAQQMRDGCLAMAAAMWPAQAASGYSIPDPPPGQTAGYCAYYSYSYDPMWSNARLAARYNGFRSGDGPIKEWEVTAQNSYYLQGATTSFKGPTCRN